MGARSKVEQLPKAVKEWLDKALVEGNFSGYEALAEHLKGLGHDLSKSGLHRYGADFERSLRAIKLATEQARAVNEAASDDGNDLSDALLRVVQEKAFTALTKMSEEDTKRLSFASLAKIASESGFASTTVKEFRAKTREKAKVAASEVAAIVKKAGLTNEAAKEIQAKILGIAA